MSQHISRLVSSLLFVVLLFGFSPGLVSAQTEDTAAIKKLVEQFFSAYAKEDIEGLMSLWSQDSTELTASKQSFQKAFNDLKNIEIKNLDIRHVTIEANEAKVRLKVELSALNAQTGKPAERFRKREPHLTIGETTRRLEGVAVCPEGD